MTEPLDETKGDFAETVNSPLSLVVRSISCRDWGRDVGRKRRTYKMAKTETDGGRVFSGRPNVLFPSFPPQYINETDVGRNASWVERVDTSVDLFVLAILAGGVRCAARHIYRLQKNPEDFKKTVRKRIAVSF